MCKPIESFTPDQIVVRRSDFDDFTWPGSDIYDVRFPPRAPRHVPEEVLCAICDEESNDESDSENDVDDDQGISDPSSGASHDSLSDLSNLSDAYVELSSSSSATEEPESVEEPEDLVVADAGGHGNLEKFPLPLMAISASSGRTAPSMRTACSTPAAASTGQLGQANDLAREDRLDV